MTVLRNDGRISVVIRLLYSSLVLLAMSLASLPVKAGQTCTQKPMSASHLSAAFSLAQKTEIALNDIPRGINQARMAVIARVGADVSDHGLRYTHMGLAYQTSAGQQWRVVHLLNHCGESDSGVFTEGLANFLFDDPFEYRVMISPVNRKYVSQLVAGLERSSMLSVHDTDYSMIANPYRDKYQNSNQWLLEWMTVMVRELPRTRRQAQGDLKAMGYAPSTIHIPAAERLGARLFRANVSFDDHPLSARMRGRFKIVSVESAVVYMQDQGWLADSREIIH